MLGITLADAAVFCTIAGAIVAMVRGTSQGDSAKKQAIQSAPMVNIATGIVEANQFADYMKVLDKLAIALKGHAEALDRQHQVKFTNALEELADKVDEALEARREHPHRRK
ncbi:hypothetical protein SAMN03159423_4894 [Bradyrhizobium sp. NFR13]|uniref:hypothetical protein n=1 Tax=Bradyrhizobium sp. NFR13 TaxID=1566285 RepID=UPI0008E19226|nr:hypothetical protein [Bradyrhizobium sp. NFR13]SFM00954.1 hypothetical protein SAMN03159423_4894 [Bradyrhizobium sp. NFR13]